MPPLSIQLEETETHYLLKCPPSQKERAKRIEGWWWNGENSKWEYLRTNRNYDALISEFKDDLTELKITRPDPFSTGQSVAQNAVLSSSVESLQSAFQSAIEAKSTENDALHKKIAQLEQQLAEQQAQNQTQAEEIKGLNTEAKTAKSRKSGISEWIKETAKLAANHPGFNEVVDALKFNQTMPIQLLSYLEQELRFVCESDSNNAHELLSIAQQQNIIRDSADMAHTLRKQRNAFAHQSVDPQTSQVRILLCLFCAALVWSELPQPTLPPATSAKSSSKSARTRKAVATS